MITITFMNNLVGGIFGFVGLSRRFRVVFAQFWRLGIFADLPLLLGLQLSRKSVFHTISGIIAETIPALLQNPLTE